MSVVPHHELTWCRNAKPRERHLPSVSLAVHELSDRSTWERLAMDADHKFWDQYSNMVKDIVGRVCRTKTGAERHIL